MREPGISAIGWQSTPLCRSYLLVLVESLRIYVEDQPGSASDRMLWWALGVLGDGQCESLGAWAESVSHGSNWHQMFGNLKDRGVEQVGFVVSSDSSMLQSALRATYPKAIAIPRFGLWTSQAIGKFASHSRAGGARDLHWTSSDRSARTAHGARAATARNEHSLTSPQTMTRSDASPEQMGPRCAMPDRHRRTMIASQEVVRHLRRLVCQMVARHGPFLEPAEAAAFVADALIRAEKKTRVAVASINLATQNLAGAARRRSGSVGTEALRL